MHGHVKQWICLGRCKIRFSMNYHELFLRQFFAQEHGHPSDGRKKILKYRNSGVIYDIQIKFNGGQI